MTPSKSLYESLAKEKRKLSVYISTVFIGKDRGKIGMKNCEKSLLNKEIGSDRKRSFFRSFLIDRLKDQKKRQTKIIPVNDWLIIII